MSTGAQGGECSAPAMNVLSDAVLLQICRAKADDPSVTSGWLADLRLVVQLVTSAYSPTDCAPECAMALLASLLGQLAQHNPVHLPFGYNGPTIRSLGWLDRQALERVGQQVVGLAREKCTPKAVSSTVGEAITNAIQLGFMEQKDYDAWRPGMRSGSGWRSAVKATLYGVTRAHELVNAPASGTPPHAQPGNVAGPATIQGARPQLQASPQPVAGRRSAVNTRNEAAPVTTQRVTVESGSPEPGPAVKLACRGEPCWVCGKEKHALTDAQYSVILALQEAGEDGLSKDALESVRPSARRILKKLRLDEDWAKVILMPGRTNGRYRLRT